MDEKETTEQGKLNKEANTKFEWLLLFFLN